MAWPHPIGTVVRGVVPPLDLPVRALCADHLFELVTDPLPVEYGCGFMQRARCLVCGYVTQAIDADFWTYEATPEDFDRCRKVAVAEARRLLDVADDIALLALGERRQMVDLG
jgi:hypothetical protein